MPTVQPGPERHRIVLDESFYAVDPATVDTASPVLRPALSRTVAHCAPVWRVVLIGLAAVSALAMIAFALVKAIQPAVLCMLVLVLVKAADHVAGRRFERA
ncbi:hypothetical protein [Amycolatopsis granulosa]|uniref:hypothetical protein n=1 Tax=Amycolatopsis granulosa TaxID=185684 RepID=UPI001ABBC90B|nr:hypothetical protein [Amycolatopsis granulosa]NIH87677.1 anti-sigma-K factor RskA [Amycolatopsis granulosa]